MTRQRIHIAVVVCLTLGLLSPVAMQVWAVSVLESAADADSGFQRLKRNQQIAPVVDAADAHQPIVRKARKSKNAMRSSHEFARLWKSLGTILNKEHSHPVTIPEG